MKALFLSIGTRGDMEPFLALAQLFRQRGHKVLCGMPAQFKTMAQAQEIPFQPFDPRFIDLIDSKDGRMIMGQQGSLFSRIGAIARIAKKSLSLQGDMIREQHAMIKRENPDLVIYHGKCIYPVIWGLHHPGKTIMMSAMPCLVHSVRDYPNIGIRVNLGPRFNGLTYRLVNHILSITVKRMVKFIPTEEVNKRLLTKAKIKDFLINHQRYFYSFSPGIFERPAHWPKHVQITGFRELEKAKNYQPSEELSAFLEEHSKILFVSFGSMTNSNPAGKAEAIISLLAKHEIPAILNTSWGGLEAPDSYPDHVLFVKNVPYDWLFPKVYAVIHHGGSGTTHTGLKFGCATMIIPHIVDQFFWNHTIARLGVGPKGMPIKKLTVENLEAPLLNLWLNRNYKDKAQRLSQLMEKEDFANEIMAGF